MLHNGNPQLPIQKDVQSVRSEHCPAWTCLRPLYRIWRERNEVVVAMPDQPYECSTAKQSSYRRRFSGQAALRASPRSLGPIDVISFWAVTTSHRFDQTTQEVRGEARLPLAQTWRRPDLLSARVVNVSPIGLHIEASCVVLFVNVAGSSTLMGGKSCHEGLRRLWRS